MGIILGTLLVHSVSSAGASGVESILDETPNFIQVCERKQPNRLSEQKAILKMKLYSSLVEKQTIEVSGQEQMTSESFTNTVSTHAKGVIKNTTPLYREEQVVGDTWLCAYINK